MRADLSRSVWVRADLATRASLVEAALPQTQCTRCGYPDCRAYAEAIVAEACDINRCPPGGQEGVRRLAALTGRPEQPLSPEVGEEGPLRLAVIDEAWCIGCTLCIKVCPVDCIVGSSKRMHSVIAADCTGCELCVPACPVDCIAMEVETPGRTGWQAWSQQQAQAAQERYALRRERRSREEQERADRLAIRAAEKLRNLEQESSLTDPALIARKRALVQAAVDRARADRPAS